MPCFYGLFHCVGFETPPKWHELFMASPCPSEENKFKECTWVELFQVGKPTCFEIA